MASDAVLDFDRLLQPISDDKPAGEDFRLADRVIASQIKATRDESSKAETSYENPSEGEGGYLPQENWSEVFDLCEGVIAEKSKDLRVTAWLIEAAVRRHGFAGLRDGLRLARELCERYWDDIHPRPDLEDGENISATMDPLTKLNGEDADGPLVVAIHRIPVTAGRSFGPFSLWHKDFARQLEDQPSLAENLRKEFLVSSEAFDAAVSETPPDYFQTLLEDIAQCQDELAALDESLGEKCGKDEQGIPLAPGTSRIRRTLEDSCREIRKMSGVSAGDESTEVQDDDESESHAPSVGGGPAVSQKKVQTREDAFNVLLDVARFFKRTEPHSPVSYGLEQIVRWGKMSLPELLTELVRDSSTRSEMFRQVGIPEKEEE